MYSRKLDVTKNIRWENNFIISNKIFLHITEYIQHKYQKIFIRLLEII